MTVKIIATGEKLKTTPEYGLRLIEQGQAVFVPAEKPMKPAEKPAPTEGKKPSRTKGEAK